MSKVCIDLDKQFQIFVGNLPLSITNNQLGDAFRCCGEIKGVYVKSACGFGFVNFHSK